MSKSKYRSRKVNRYGMTFDSIKELKRYEELRILEQAGTISELRTQVKYVLIPAQYEEKRYPKLNAVGKGRCLERECSYIADFVYKDSLGVTVVEDTKGFKTKDYIIKRKLMLWVHGIKIREV